MNELNHNDRLLADVLGEGDAGAFRAGLLAGTLRLARRRRRLRQVRAAAVPVAFIAVLGLVLWHKLPSDQPLAPAPAKPYTMVHTQPLPPAALAATGPLAPAQTVSSSPFAQVIMTAQADARPREIGDDELLALVPKPVALVRRGLHSAELVFVNEADREEMLRN